LEPLLILVVPAAMGVLGAAMIVQPRAVIARNRDDDEAGRPVTSWDVAKTRILGLVFLASAGFFLRAILTGEPGAEFFPV